MERVYNKLVRDNIPDIIKSKGEIPVTRVLSCDEYKTELERKLKEEYEEVIAAKGRDRLYELADMIEVIKYLATAENSDLEEVLRLAKEKSAQRGAFDRKIFLEKVVAD